MHDTVVQGRISPETIEGFHARNHRDTKITLFDNVGVPNVEKLSLYGSNVVGTSLFDEYTRHGDLVYCRSS